MDPMKLEVPVDMMMSSYKWIYRLLEGEGDTIGLSNGTAIVTLLDGSRVAMRFSATRPNIEIPSSFHVTQTSLSIYSTT